MNVIIQELTNDLDQIKKVQEFLFKMIKMEFGNDYVPEWHQDIVKLETFYINPEKNNFFVAYTTDGEIIGTIGIRGYDKYFPEFKHIYSNKTTSSIWRLFVDKRYRRYGLASKMFNIAENFANEVGYSEIYLHTHKTLDGAITFWTKMGFGVVLDAEDELQTVHMDKQIHKLKISLQEVDFIHAIEL